MLSKYSKNEDSQDKTNQPTTKDFIKNIRRNQTDIPAWVNFVLICGKGRIVFVLIFFWFYNRLITDLPLKTIANLNNYVIKNIISQETDDYLDAKNTSLITDMRRTSDSDATHIVIARNKNLYASPSDLGQIKVTKSCERCQSKSNSYIDSLKYDLFKRIELEVNKG